MIKSIRNIITKQLQFRKFNPFSNESINPYTSMNHTLLKHIYIYKHLKDHVGYLIIDPQTKDMVSIDPGDYKIALKNIEKLQQTENANLRYMRSISKALHEQKQFFIKKYSQPFLQDTYITNPSSWHFEGCEVVVGDYGKNKIMGATKYSTYIKELEPFTLGELAICFLHTPGHTEDSCSIAITHVSNKSTKLPCLFTGDTILSGSVGKINNFARFKDSIQKLKAFPPETLIFPSHDASLENLFFVKTLDPQNQFLEYRIEFVKDCIEKKQFALPSTLVEEINLNPFMRTNEKYYSELLEERDPVKCLKKLNYIKNHYFQ